MADPTRNQHRTRPDVRGIRYVADRPGTVVLAIDEDERSAPVTAGDGPVTWQGADGPQGRLAAGLFTHLTGIAKSRSQVPAELAKRLHDTLDDDRLDLPAVDVHAWLRQRLPELVHDDLPDIQGAAVPPSPPATYEQLVRQSGRDCQRRVAVADARVGDDRWQAFWLPSTGELLSVFRQGLDTSDWVVTRLAANVPDDHALALAARPSTSIGDLLERHRELAAHQPEHRRHDIERDELDLGVEL